MNWVLLIVASLSIGKAASPAIAQESAITPAVAQLAMSGYRTRRHCTAVLVAPRTALTAAHCIEGRPLRDLHLLFGYDRSSYRDHVQPVAVRVVAGLDVTALCLASAPKVAPLAIHQGGSVREVSAVGYGRPAVHAQQRKTCSYTPVGVYGRVGCPLARGFSGGPLLTTGPVPQVVGIVSRSGRSKAQAVRLAGLDLPRCP